MSFEAKNTTAPALTTGEREVQLITLLKHGANSVEAVNRIWAELVEMGSPWVDPEKQDKLNGMLRYANL